jgi:hypothetical protein
MVADEASADIDVRGGNPCASRHGVIRASGPADVRSRKVCRAEFLLVSVRHVRKRT